jgi:hypothetical protein
VEKNNDIQDTAAGEEGALIAQHFSFTTSIPLSLPLAVAVPVDLICDGDRALGQFQFLAQTVHYCYAVVSAVDAGKEQEDTGR